MIAQAIFSGSFFDAGVKKLATAFSDGRVVSRIHKMLYIPSTHLWSLIRIYVSSKAGERATPLSWVRPSRKYRTFALLSGEEKIK